MFNLEIAIKDWERDLRRNPAFEDGDIAELESHLREEVARLYAEGLSEEEAFAAAAEGLGQSEQLGSEIRKVESRTGAVAWRRDQNGFWHPSIWVHFLRVAFRSQMKHRGYSLLNIYGLAMGLAACLLIAHYIQFEGSFDRYHEHSDRIYRLVDNFAKVPGAIAPVLEEELPEVEHAVRFQQLGEILFSRGEDQFYVNGGFYADSAVFEMFSYELTEGNPSTALSSPGQVVISRSLADRLFGEGVSAVGRPIAIDFDYGDEFTVSGVIENTPSQSHFQVEFLVSQASDPGPRQYDWYFKQFYTYLLADRGMSAGALESRVESVIAGHVDPERADPESYALQPLEEIHLHSDLEREIEANGNIIYLYAFGSIGGIILVLVLVNFLNLTTARSLQRGAEVGVRKAAGASRMQLIRQFLTETVVISFLAMGVAVLLAWLFMPWFSDLAGREMTFDVLEDPLMFTGIVVTPLLAGNAAGIYPALVQSAFNPVKALTGRLDGGRSGFSLRKSLVVFQFLLTSFMILATLGIYNQLSFILNKNLGFEKEQRVVIPIRSNELRTGFETVKQRLLQQDFISSVSVSGNLPDGSDWGIPVRPEGVPDGEVPATRVLAVDHDFVTTYEMKLAEGRNFDADRPTDVGAYLLNQEAVRQYGWENPMERTIGMPAIGKTDGPVIGVLEDFHFRSLHERIGPVVLIIPPTNDWYAFYTVELQGGRIQEALRYLESTWRELDPAHPFSYRFFEESIDRQYRAEQRAGELVAGLSLLSIVIAAFGLVGLVSYNVERRTKEIGIRKILGASQSAIVGMLSREFILLTILGFLTAAPLAWYAVSRWMENFAYHAGMGVGMFLLAGVVVLVITAAVLAWHTVRAALLNPVKSLRSE